jgi:hypothetical protein
VTDNPNPTAHSPEYLEAIRNAPQIDPATIPGLSDDPDIARAQLRHAEQNLTRGNRKAADEAKERGRDFALTGIDPGETTDEAKHDNLDTNDTGNGR